MSEDPYQTPGGESPPDLLIQPDRGRGVAVSSLVFLALGTAASALVMISMSRSFGLLASTGSADPQELAELISRVIWIALISMFFTLLGAIFGGMAVFGQGNRERWFLVLGLLVFVLQLGTLPLGTPVGIVLIFGMILRWREFHQSPVSNPTN